MADSELRQFALTLPSELARPALLKGKHRVRGTYPEDVGERLKGEGLWDSDVMATIDVTFDVAGTTATPRDPTYILSLIHISEPTRLGMISYAVFCLKKK